MNSCSTIVGSHGNAVRRRTRRDGGSTSVKAVGGRRPGHPPVDPLILMAFWRYATGDGLASDLSARRSASRHRRRNTMATDKLSVARLQPVRTRSVVAGSQETSET